MSTNSATLPADDWHPADVVAALRKKGKSLRQLAAANGYKHIDTVLHKPWLAGEQIVAKALGLKPQEIWPTRYIDPAARKRAFQLTRKVKVTMPRRAEARA